MTKRSSFSYVLPVLVISLIFTSCGKRHGWGVQGRGEITTEKRSLASADRIKLNIDADVYYKQDSVYFLEVSAQPNILAVLTTEVDGTTLKIDYRRNVWKHKKVSITVHTPDMRSMHISGSGNIHSEPVLTSHLSLSISGSGDISLSRLNASRLDADISGSGNISVNGGTCNSQDFGLSGSGNIRSANCVTTSNRSVISGSGNIEVHVTESLDVNISGSGNLRYRGNPGSIVRISGSGRVTKI